MTTHELKTWPMQWESVNDGSKRVELRKGDRDYQRGDVLVLMEWDLRTGQYTGRVCRRRVTHILRGEDLFGLTRGYVAMSLTDAPEFAEEI